VQSPKFKTLLALSCALFALDSFAAGKPVLLYSRRFNAAGETRYLPAGQFKPLLDRLAADFTVRVHAEPLTPETLGDVRVLLIANPSDAAVGAHPAPHHVDDRDVEYLSMFVRRGNGLILLGNQENHNLEVTNMNRLLTKFGLQWTNLHTDPKLLPLPKETPVVGGLRWAYYSGNLVLVDTNHPARPRALVENNLAIKPARGDRNQPGALMAVAELGRGRAVVSTDAGWLADWAFDERGVGGVSLKGHDNYEIFRRLALWASGARL
jgi:hypothetical protein